MYLTISYTSECLNISVGGFGVFGTKTRRYSCEMFLHNAVSLLSLFIMQQLTDKVHEMYQMRRDTPQ